MQVGISKEEFILLLADSYIEEVDNKKKLLKDKLYKVLKKKKLVIRYI